MTLSEVEIAAKGITSWRVKPKPSNYVSPTGEAWVIIDEDGDIYGFYHTSEQAIVEFEKEFLNVK